MKRRFVKGSLVLGAMLMTLSSGRAGAMDYLVMLRNGTSADSVRAGIAAAGGEFKSALPQIGVVLASAPSMAFMDKLGAVAGVEAVLPDLRLKWTEPADGVPLSGGAQLAAIPNYFPLQWGLQAIQAPAAWAAGVRGNGAVVAVLDTGFVLEHPDLQGQYLPEPVSQSFVPGETLAFTYNPDPDVKAEFSHGTHVAGIIAAKDDGQGVVGVAPEAKLLLLKVMSDQGWGDFYWILQGIVYAADQKADIINMSLSGSISRRAWRYDPGTPDDPKDDIIIPGRWADLYLVFIQRGLQYAHQQGTTVFAAAGNASLDRDHTPAFVVVPADAMGVIQVSATGPLGWFYNHQTNLDVPAYYSNYGQSHINFAGPGGNLDFDLYNANDRGWPYDMVLSCANYEDTWGYAFGAGTSMATPHAAGVAALIISKHGGPMLPDQVKAALVQSADDLGKPGVDDFYGAGRVNAARAVR